MPAATTTPQQEDAQLATSGRPPMGFIAVECFFERPPGDAFNEHTWDFPLIRQRAQGSKESQLVTKDAYDDAFIDRFVEAGLILAEKGCVGLLTSCGFLAMAQPRLAARLPIPIATSSLIQVAPILSWLPPSKSVLILTFNGERLNYTHLQQLGVPEAAFKRVHIVGAPTEGHLQRLVKYGDPYVFADLEAELVGVVLEAAKQYDDIGAVVLECTQMPPFAESIHHALGGRAAVYDVYSMGSWFYDGLVRRTPASWKKRA